MCHNKVQYVIVWHHLWAIHLFSFVHFEFTTIAKLNSEPDGIITKLGLTYFPTFFLFQLNKMIS